MRNAGARRPDWRARLFLSAPLLSMAALGLYSQFIYVERSRGEFSMGGSGLVEIPVASSTGLASELDGDRRSNRSRLVLSDTPNGVLGKLQSLSMRGVPVIFPCQDFFGSVVGTLPVKAAVELYARLGVNLIGPKDVAYAELLRDRRKATFSREAFQFASEIVGERNTFLVINIEAALPEADASVSVFRTTPLQNLLNRRAFRNPAGRANLAPKTMPGIHNHLIFVMSDLGKPFSYADLENESLYQLEPDLAYARETMAGVGRYSVLEVVNPTRTGRLALNLTATYKSDGENRLPPAKVEGAEQSGFGLIGRGSARVFSAPVSARMIHGRYYIGVDLGVQGSYFPETRSGAMNWFGAGIRADSRRLVGFARDVSLLSEKEFADLAPPAFVKRFPADLANPDLEYSGIYEDGWVSERCYAMLRQPQASGYISIKGSVPLVRERQFESKVSLREDGAEISSKTLRPGDFEISAAASSRAGNHKIELQFSRYQRLPAPDNRPAAALISFIGFTPSAPPSDERDITGTGAARISGNGWYPVEHFQGQMFRWVSNDAGFEIPAAVSAGKSARQFVAMDMELEPGPGVGSQAFILRILDSSDRQISANSVRGRQLISLRLPVSAAAPCRFRLHVDGGGRPARGDSRTLNFRVFRLSGSRSISTKEP